MNAESVANNKMLASKAFYILLVLWGFGFMQLNNPLLRATSLSDNKLFKIVLLIISFDIGL